MKRRNKHIRTRIQVLKELGFKLKDAIKIVADEFYLSEARIIDIWRYKKCG